MTRDPLYLTNQHSKNKMRQRRNTTGKTSFHLAKRIEARSEAESLRRALKTLGWAETSTHGEADVVWDVWLSDAETDKHATPVPGQVLSRFPAMADCCRKAVFATIFSRLRRLLPPDAPLNDGRFIPPQFSLPRQKAAMREHADAAIAAAQSSGEPRPYYIVKPDVGSRGDGIRLTAEPERKNWNAGEESVVQEYVAKPMLVDGLKFDLRLYVLVADVQDSSEDDAGLMRLFLFREGLARFAVDSYEPPSADNLKNVHMHLTNYSLNRKNENFKYDCDDASGGDGSKRTVSSVFERLQSTGRIESADELWEDIEKLVARSMGVVQPILAGSRGRWSNTCFQVLGMDVLLDESGQPWLIEINDHPSFRIDLTLDKETSMPSAVDEAVKLPMLSDAMRVVSNIHGLDVQEGPRSRRSPSPASPVGTPSPAAKRDGSGAATPPRLTRALEELRAIADAKQEKLRGSPRGGGAYGTNFYEVKTAVAETKHLQLLSRLRDIFELHSPSSSVFEATWGEAKREDAQETSSAGPKWKAPTFSRFLQSAGLVGGHRASAVAAGLSRPDADLIFASVCGKGGSMDLLDFTEALSRVASRLYPTGPNEEQASPTELISKLIAAYLNESNGSACAPASARAATAARAQAALKAVSKRPPQTPRSSSPMQTPRGTMQTPRGTMQTPRGVMQTPRGVMQTPRQKMQTPRNLGSPLGTARGSPSPRSHFSPRNSPEVDIS